MFRKVEVRCNWKDFQSLTNRDLTKPFDLEPPKPKSSNSSIEAVSGESQTSIMDVSNSSGESPLKPKSPNPTNQTLKEGQKIWSISFKSDHEMEVFT